jgi:hypothetical protein
MQHLFVALVLGKKYEWVARVGAGDWIPRYLRPISLVCLD